jgi:hypothetical protein
MDARVAHPVLEHCGWLIEVASHNPEPDSIEDCTIEIRCGGRVFCLEGDEHGEAAGEAGWECEAGHRHLTYGSPGQRAEEVAEAYFERWLSEMER